MDSVEVTKLLAAWQAEGRPGLDSLLPAIYHELHSLAKHHLKRSGSSPTLQPTAIVNEAYLRLARANPHGFLNRRQFFGYASRLIRHVLVDHLRARKRLKRDAPATTLGALESAVQEDRLSAEIVLAVHTALKNLETVDSRQAQIVEMKFFGGLRLHEIAEALECSLASVERHWSVGRRRLALQLGS